jgi:lipopolysaccharide/colanic/teichoic acid biosynthesis glycosyltransferase
MSSPFSSVSDVTVRTRAKELADRRKKPRFVAFCRHTRREMETLMTAVAGVRLARTTSDDIQRGAVARRMFDVVASAALIIVAVPMIAVFAVVLAVSLRAWPFFVQTRVGKNGQTFRFLKLRTLPTSAPAYTDKYQLQTIRLPKAARVLRAAHLDELPQLFLVLAGKMSLVGPRPEMPHLHESFIGMHRTAREALRPGCAGIWQVSIDNDRLIHEAPEYDLFYAEHASLRLDLWILWRTALLTVGGPRVTIDEVPAWALSAQRRDLYQGFSSSLAA